MMHWQGIITIVTIICATCLIIQDKTWGAIGLILLILLAISPTQPKSKKENNVK